MLRIMTNVENCQMLRIMTNVENCQMLRIMTSEISNASAHARITKSLCDDLCVMIFELASFSLIKRTVMFI